jgi:hypothetical protein
MGSIHIKVWAVFEPRTGMRCRAEAAHFANAKRAHDGRAIGGAATNDFDVGGATAESVEFPAEREYRIETGRKDLSRTMSVFFPHAAQDLGRKDDRCGRRVGVRLCRIAVLWSGQDRELVFRQVPTGACGIVAD